MSGEGTRPGQLALAVYCQLEADVDDTLAAQAVKCLVHLSKEMLEADRTAGLLQTTSSPGLVPAALQELEADLVPNSSMDATAELDLGQNGAQPADSEAESEGEEEEDRQQLGLDGTPGLSLQGLVRRMAKMAGDR